MKKRTTKVAAANDDSTPPICEAERPILGAVNRDEDRVQVPAERHERIDRKYAAQRAMAQQRDDAAVVDDRAASVRPG
jgi:hypothetical protein